MILGDAALPAAFVFQRDLIEPGGDLIGHALKIGIDSAGHEGAGDGGLF